MERQNPEIANQHTIKIFLDTNVYISALASETGASSAIIYAAEAGALQVFTSPEIFQEARKVLLKKFHSPKLFECFQNLLVSLSPKIVQVSKKEVQKVSWFCYDLEDAPILAASLKSPVHYLITLDKKAFKKQTIKSKTGLAIISPAEFMKIFRKMIGN